MSLPPAAQEALTQFNQPQSWEQRVRLLMQWGNRLVPLTESERTPAHQVMGCESRVWLIADPLTEQQCCHFRADSESRLLRGLLALLLVRVNGLSMEELAPLDLPDWFQQLGLARQLSPSRTNGLNAVLQQMRHLP